MYTVYMHECTLYCFILVVCVGCPSGWHCCGKWWGKCVCKHPGWDSCCWKVPDAICHARNAACWVLKKALNLALTAAIWVVDNSRHLLDIAKGALYVARDVVHVAEYRLDAAIAYLEGVKKVYRIGVNAFNALNKFIPIQVINIREIYFRVGLDVASGGRFECRVIGTMMGLNINHKLKIDVHNICSIAMSLADIVVPGLSKYIC